MPDVLCEGRGRLDSGGASGEAYANRPMANSLDRRTTLPDARLPNKDRVEFLLSQGWD